MFFRSVWSRGRADGPVQFLHASDEDDSWPKVTGMTHRKSLWRWLSTPSSRCREERSRYQRLASISEARLQ